MIGPAMRKGERGVRLRGRRPSARLRGGYPISSEMGGPVGNSSVGEAIARPVDGAGSRAAVGREGPVRPARPARTKPYEFPS